MKTGSKTPYWRASNWPDEFREAVILAVIAMIVSVAAVTAFDDAKAPSKVSPMHGQSSIAKSSSITSRT